jgi:hypothetical protein
MAPSSSNRGGEMNPGCTTFPLSRKHSRYVTLFAMLLILTLVAETPWADDLAGAFSLTGTPTAGRIFDAATKLPDGTVLIAGGLATDVFPSRSAERYDPASGTFTLTGSLGSPRRLYTATLLPNGKALLAGGVGDGNSALNSAESHDPATGAFSPTGDMSTPRSSHKATLLADGSVLITAGFNFAAGYLSSAEI